MDDPRTSGDQPGTRWTVMAVAAGAAVLLALNNPTEADARRFIGERLNAAMRGSAPGDTPAERAGAAFAMALIAPVVDNAIVIERRNLVVASHYTVKPNAFLGSLLAASDEQDALGEICLIGVFGRFFPCGAKGRVASQLMDGRFPMPGDSGSTAEAAPPASAEPPSEDTTVSEPPPPPPAPDEAAEAPGGYADVADVLLAIGVRVRAGDFDAAERRLDEVEQFSLSPEDRAIASSLRQRIATGRRVAAAEARAGAAGFDGPAVAQVAPRIDPRRSPSTDDFCPPEARSAGIEGVTTVSACVGPDGRVTGDPTVTNSSGETSLDEAAVSWARLARFTPGAEDGRAIEMCTRCNVRFKLTN